MNRKQQLALIYRHTHRDYRGKVNGTSYILVLREGGTWSVPLSDLTEEEIADQLPAAIKAEAKRIAKKETT